MLRRLLWCSTPLIALFFWVSTFAAAPAPQSRNFDWPQWQGQDRTAVSRETGLLKEWPANGPPLAWKIDTLGGGYSTPSIAAGRIYGMSYRGDDEIVWALDEKTGQEIWTAKIATANRKIGYGEGSRCTPTVEGDVLYTLGVSGDLVCLKTATGEEVWHKNSAKDFDGKVGGWKYSESPLIDGDKLLCTPGGKKATLLALNKKTAETIWMAAVPGRRSSGLFLDRGRRHGRPTAIHPVSQRRRGGRDGRRWQVPVALQQAVRRHQLLDAGLPRSARLRRGGLRQGWRHGQADAQQATR